MAAMAQSKTGMIGTKYLVNFLDDTGRDPLILPFYQSADYPGWGYMVENGATTMWEQWNGFWSQIHSCFASADNWLYRGLLTSGPAGLNVAFYSRNLASAAFMAAPFLLAV